MWPFFNFQYGFRSSRSTADLLTAVSHRIARAFNISGATGAVAFDMAVFLLFSVIDGFKWFCDICDIAIYADDTAVYSKCDQASDLWQQLELASELRPDL